MEVNKRRKALSRWTFAYLHPLPRLVLQRAALLRYRNHLVAIATSTEEPRRHRLAFMHRANVRTVALCHGYVSRI